MLHCVLTDWRNTSCHYKICRVTHVKKLDQYIFIASRIGWGPVEFKAPALKPRGVHSFMKSCGMKLAKQFSTGRWYGCKSFTRNRKIASLHGTNTDTDNYM